MISSTRPSSAVAVLLAAAFLAWGAGPERAAAHENHEHGEAPAAETSAAGGDAAPAPEEADFEPFPADIGGAFALIDQNGRAVTDADFRGRYMLIFFGYAQCESICPVGLKRMTEALDLLGERGEAVQPLLITVDPENDTPEALAAHLPTVHPRLLGLTGTPEAIAAAQKSYKVNSKRIGQSWKGNPVISHGSYIYLMGRDGELLTVLPPVLSSKSMAEIIGRYLS